MYAAAIFLVGYVIIQVIASLIQPELKTYWWRVVIKGERVEGLPPWLRIDEEQNNQWGGL